METKNYNLKTYEGVSAFVHDWHVQNFGENYGFGNDSDYVGCLCNELGFEFDGFDDYGSKCYSNGYVRIAVFYNHGEYYWDMEPAQGESDTAGDNFYNTTNDTPNIYGYY